MIFLDTDTSAIFYLLYLQKFRQDSTLPLVASVSIFSITVCLNEVNYICIWKYSLEILGIPWKLPCTNSSSLIKYKLPIKTEHIQRDYTSNLTLSFSKFSFPLSSLNFTVFAGPPHVAPSVARAQHTQTLLSNSNCLVQTACVRRAKPGCKTRN